VLAMSANHEQAQRLLASTPPTVGGAIGDVSKARASAGLLRFAALVDAVTPWIDEAVRRGNPEAKAADEIISQVHTGLEILKSLRTVTCDFYTEGDALVGHVITEIHDVP